MFKKAIGGIHYEIADLCFKEILKGYEIAHNFEEIAQKIDEIEGRRRYTVNNTGQD